AADVRRLQLIADCRLPIADSSLSVITSAATSFGSRNQKLRHHFAELPTDEPLQFRLPAVHRKFDAAHDVAAVTGLRVERSLHGQHVAVRQVEQLRGNRGAAEIYRDAQACARCELK